jgi:hypothetical protein
MKRGMRGKCQGTQQNIGRLNGHILGHNNLLGIELVKREVERTYKGECHVGQKKGEEIGGHALFIKFSEGKARQARKISSNVHLGTHNHKSAVNKRGKRVEFGDEGGEKECTKEETNAQSAMVAHTKKSLS